MDPNYWKQQFFIGENLRKMAYQGEVWPQKHPMVAAVLVAPEDAKCVGAIKPSREMGTRLDRMILMGEASGELEQAFADQCKIWAAAGAYAEWKPGRQSEIRKASIDLAVLAPGTMVRLGAQGLILALKEVQRVLKSDGRLVFVANEKDEEILGGRIEAILQQEASEKDLAELRNIDVEVPLDAAGAVLRDGGFRPVRAQRDECGLVLGLCCKTI